MQCDRIIPRLVGNLIEFGSNKGKNLTFNKFIEGCYFFIIYVGVNINCVKI